MIHCGRDHLVLGFAGLGRVVDLLAHGLDEVMALAAHERLHELPGGVVGDAVVADLPLPYESVHGLKCLLQRSLPVPLVQVVEVDVIPAQAL